MPLEQVLQYLFSGLTIGSIYAIVAIGYNIIYKPRASSISPRANS